MSAEYFLRFLLSTRNALYLRRYSVFSYAHVKNTLKETAKRHTTQTMRAGREGSRAGDVR